MLVRVHYKSGTNAEQVLLDRLRRWRGKGAPAGIATVNCSLFSQGRLQHLNAVIWTPGGCIVAETAALTGHQEGTLTVPLNGPWTIGGEPATFAGISGRSPLDQSRAHTSALQTWLADQGLGQRAVHGTVLVIPFDNAKIAISQLWSDPAFAVTVSDNDGALRALVASISTPANEGWTANDIAIVFRAMGLARQLPSPQELLHEGFLGPIDPLLWQDSGEQPAAGAAATEPQRQPRLAGVLTQQWVYSPWRIYPKVPGEQDWGRATLRITLAIGMLLSLAWITWTVCRVAAAWTPL